MSGSLAVTLAVLYGWKLCSWVLCSHSTVTLKHYEFMYCLISVPVNMK